MVVGEFANGVQIIDITDPRDPAPISSVFDGEGGFDALEGVLGMLALRGCRIGRTRWLPVSLLTVSRL